MSSSGLAITEIAAVFQAQVAEQRVARLVGYQVGSFLGSGSGRNLESVRSEAFCEKGANALFVVEHEHANPFQDGRSGTGSMVGAAVGRVGGVRRGRTTAHI